MLSDHTRMGLGKLELNLSRDVKGNKKGFYKYVNSKRKSRENMGLLLNGEGEQATNDMEKTEVLNAFFASVFTGKMSLQECQIPEISGKVRSKEDLHLMEEDQVR